MQGREIDEVIWECQLEKVPLKDHHGGVVQLVSASGSAALEGRRRCVVDPVTTNPLLPVANVDEIVLQEVLILDFAISLGFSEVVEVGCLDWRL